MGQLKDEAMKAGSEDIQERKLEDAEANYLKMLNVSLQFHVHAQKIMSGFLYYVATHRLGYKKGVNLAFQFDFDDPENILTIQLMPATPTPQPEP